VKVTIIRRVRWVEHKWKLVSAKQYLVWRPEEAPVIWMAEEREVFARRNKVRRDLTKKQR